MRVTGVGPSPCFLAIVGPYPGQTEDWTGIPFSPGRPRRDGTIRPTAGDELNRFLNGVDLPERDDVYLTNLHQFYHGKDYEYSTEETEEATIRLLAELEEVDPHVIVAMGREVARLFLGDVDITDVESIPWLDPQGTGRVIFPMVHIAAGMRNPEMSPLVVRGFQQLALHLNGELPARVLFDDPFPEPVYEEIESEFQLDASLATLKPTSHLAIDTEGWPHNPWSLQYSDEAGRGFLIRANRQGLLSRFMERVRRVNPRIVFHSALHDLAMGRALDTDFEGLAFDDTQVMAYLLQLEALGLKPGCLRHCNMKMQEYADVTGDLANELAREYLIWLLDSETLDYEEAQQREFDRIISTQCRNKDGSLKFRKNGTPVFPRITKLPALPRSPLHKAAQRVLGSKRPYSLWQEQIEDVQVAGYNRLGPLPEPTLDYVPAPTAVSYGCRDADGTHRLHREYSRRIDAMGLRGVYELELGTYPLIDRMQRIGIKPDLAHFAELSELLSGEVQRLQETLDLATERTGFNANSGDQVAAYLFDELGLDEIKITRSGRGSTNDKVLEALENEHPEHPVISTIRSYRETYKLKNTFVDRIPDFVHRWPFDGRVHATFRTTRVVTGRLAASDPNVLAQPEHGYFAPFFKMGWVAEDGHSVCAWDESQIELRGLAHISQDPVMCGVFRGEIRNPDGSPIDLHAALAERIFGVKPKDQDKHKHRLPAKAINFGIPMGMTCRGLSVELRKNGVDADEDTAQRWLDETLGLYTGVRRYMERQCDEARRNGFIRCLSGRIRYIGGIRSTDDRVREEAERFAFSTPVQESAQFIMKQAEATVWNTVLPYFWKRGHWVEPILQIHDCLKMECEQGLEQELNLAMVSAMTNVPRGFSVPLAVEGEWGQDFTCPNKF